MSRGSCARVSGLNPEPQLPQSAASNGGFGAACDGRRSAMAGRIAPKTGHSSGCREARPWDGRFATSTSDATASVIGPYSDSRRPRAILSPCLHTNFQAIRDKLDPRQRSPLPPLKPPGRASRNGAGSGDANQLTVSHLPEIVPP